MEQGKQAKIAIDEREKELLVAEEREDEGTIRELEAEVKEMADMIQKSRRALPGRLAEALSKQLSAQRPRRTVDGTLDFQDYVSPKESELDNGASIPDLDEEMHQKLQILRTKLRCNVEAMPEVLKRIKGCIERVNRLSQSSGGINPVFKKRRKNCQMCL